MEMRKHLNQDPGAAGEMSVNFDIATGEVRSYGAGFWSIEQTMAFFDDWRCLIHRIHAAGGSVSALVDMRESSVQKADVADIIATATANIYTKGDSIAMVVPTNLAKMQMRRILDTRYHAFFTSMDMATAWLKSRRMIRSAA